MERAHGRLSRVGIEAGVLSVERGVNLGILVAVVVQCRRGVERSRSLGSLTPTSPRRERRPAFPPMSIRGVYGNWMDSVTRSWSADDVMTVSHRSNFLTLWCSS